MSQEDLLRWSRNWDLIGLGGKRLALRAREGGVWKIPWREKGAWDNEIEWRVWQGADLELRSMLCPLLGRQSQSVRQASCRPVAFTEIGAQGLEIVSCLAKYGISDSAVNLGWYENRLVCYDYAYISAELFRKTFE